ncbi:hypothetical protein BD410DRAFT_845348 [Rickenella mellea]|uniref:Uncharacterized protein n=1 Tax=Rickenella mellea TaxID=50990 RepID=A0A4Y7PJ72_9AGAM|nr:hypothetical protein BD410DRAFT_845348 [Rickenella mellea]
MVEESDVYAAFVGRILGVVLFLTGSSWISRWVIFPASKTHVTLLTSSSRISHSQVATSSSKYRGPAPSVIDSRPCQRSICDVAFWFRKKTGWSKVEASGLAIVVLGGGGITIDVHVLSANKNNKLIGSQIPRPQADPESVCECIRARMNTALLPARSHAESGNETDCASILQETFERKKYEAQSMTSNADKKFNVTTNADSMLIPDKGRPAGWINRQSERSTSGSEWRSKAFSVIGSVV